jgi:hypothetical protein
VLASIAAGCGGSQSPGDFITGVLRQEIAGQWAKQWESLNPGHQKLISQDQYVTCSKRARTSIGTPEATIKVQKVEDAPIDVHGLPERTSKLVTVKFIPTPGAAQETFHIHVVRDNGKWTWILGRDYLDALAAGKCPDGSRLPP